MDQNRAPHNETVRHARHLVNSPRSHAGMRQNGKSLDKDLVHKLHF